MGEWAQMTQKKRSRVLYFEDFDDNCSFQTFLKNTAFSMDWGGREERGAPETAISLLVETAASGRMAETFSGRRRPRGQYWPVGVHEETGLRNDAYRYQETTLRNSGEAHSSPGTACKGGHPPRLLPPARLHACTPARDPTPATHPAAPRTPRPAPRLSPRPASLTRLRSPCGPTSRASTYNCHSAQCLVGHKEGTPERLVWREGDYFSQFHPRPPRREEAATRTADGMAGAPEERGPGPSAGEQLQQQHVACQVFPERLAQGKSQQGFLSGFFTNNQKCQLMLVKTLQTSRS